jgi:hypothetical protein
MSNICPICKHRASKSGKQFTARSIMNHMRNSHGLINPGRDPVYSVEELKRLAGKTLKIHEEHQNVSDDM